MVPSESGALMLLFLSRLLNADLSVVSEVSASRLGLFAQFSKHPFQITVFALIYMSVHVCAWV